ncbi:anaerobic C4-dicarboxylate transporter family protein [Actinotalea sp. M2MS4P-6]|uniref:anaerobic C4-dicarboxylate transporter family protein n=1 Tax=Actinotalea sp. M2MS4P-6 TaxID=2983762 RepID=UPI0021E42012|nr:anaerobic C4-dicarboxylate transporter family protein [Actinotalea sp. M2MS4P-6]MCV2393174.1 anaerobic C4-dicarboxylate transporter family protein [Actinotalea sp. M2MS4P-6]
MELALQAATVLLAIALGVRTKGMTVGLWGAAGVLVLVWVFGLPPGSVPTSAIFVIFAVVTAAGAMQAAGGIDYLVGIAQRVIRAHPNQVTFIAPYVAWLFATGAGTGFVYYSILPVIYEVAYGNKVRPERPMAIAPTASQMGITSSPVSSAMAIMVGLMAPLGFEITQILSIVLPSTAVAIGAAALVQNRIGKPLDRDPVYQRRLAAGEVTAPEPVDVGEASPAAKRAAWIFGGGILLILLFGIFDQLRPAVPGEDGPVPLEMTTMIQIIMLIVALVILLWCRAKSADVPRSQVFRSGMSAIVALWGVSWLANTFIAANQDMIVTSLGNLADNSPIFIAVALFVVAALTTSQSSATIAIIPIGIALGMEPWQLTAMWMAVIGLYTFPINGSQLATIELDATGTTRISRFVIYHSFTIGMLVMATVSVLVGLAIGATFYG